MHYIILEYISKIENKQEKVLLNLERVFFIDVLPHNKNCFHIESDSGAILIECAFANDKERLINEILDNLEDRLHL